MAKKKYIRKSSEKGIMKLIREGRFTVYRNGNVYRNVESRRGKLVRIPRVLLTGGDDRFSTITATVDGVYYHARAHRIIWQWFNGDIPEGYVIWHINRDKRDNRLSNLKLITKDECGGGFPESTREQAIEVRKLYGEGESIACISNHLGLRTTHVYHITSGNVWKKLVDEVPLDRTRRHGYGRAALPVGWRETRKLVELAEARELLTERNYQIMKDRYVGRMSLSAIGEKYKLTKEAIRIICVKAEEKLKEG